MIRCAMFAIFAVMLFIPASAQAESEWDYFDLEYASVIARLGLGTPYDAVYMPDGETFILATGAGVRFYNNAPLFMTRFIAMGDHRPKRISVSPDGKLLATGGDDVRLWDIETGVLLDVMQTDYGVHSLAFSPDGSLLAVSKGWVSPNRGIFIYDVQSGRQQIHLAPESSFGQLAFHPDERRLYAMRLFVCCGEAVVFDLDTGAMQPLSEHVHEGVSSFVLSPERGELIAASSSMTVFDMNMTGAQALRTGDFFEARNFLHIAMREGGDSFLTLTLSGDLTVWDTQSLTPLETRSLELTPQITAVSPNGSHLAAVDPYTQHFVHVDIEAGSVTTLDYLEVADGPIAVGEERAFFTLPGNRIGWWHLWRDEYGTVGGHTASINALLIGDNGWLYSAGDDGTLRRWNAVVNADENAVQAQMDEGIVLFDWPGARITAMTQADTGELFAVVCTIDSAVLIKLDAETGGVLPFSDGGDHDEMPLPGIRLMDCNATLGTAEYGRITYIDGSFVYHRSTLEGRIVERLRVPMSNPYALSYRLDGLLLAAQAGTVMAFEHYGGTEYGVRVLAGHAYDVTAFISIPPLMDQTVSSACARFVYNMSGDWWCDGVDMAVIDLLGRRYPLIGHSDVVRRMAMHPRLPAFVSQSSDGTLILWGAPRNPAATRFVGGDIGGH